MDIKLIKPADDDMVKETVIRWQSAARKNFRAIGLYALFSGLYFLLGMAEINKNGTFWNFYTCIGVAFIFLSIASLYSLYKGRTKWIARAKFCMNLQIKSKSVAEFFFTDSAFSCRDALSYVEIKWSGFSHYRLYKGYVFLYLTNSDSGAILFNSKKLSGNDFSTIMTFISDRMSPQK